SPRRSTVAVGLDTGPPAPPCSVPLIACSAPEPERRTAMTTFAALLVIAALALAGLVGPVAAQTGAAWGVYGGDTANTRYSTLNQVNASNVGRLKVAWALQLGSLRSQESTPIVVDDLLYVTSSHGPKNVFAVDARTGEVKWRYSPEVPAGIEQ